MIPWKKVQTTPWWGFLFRFWVCLSAASCGIRGAEVWEGLQATKEAQSYEKQRVLTAIEKNTLFQGLDTAQKEHLLCIIKCCGEGLAGALKGYLGEKPIAKTPPFGGEFYDAIGSKVPLSAFWEEREVCFLANRFQKGLLAMVEEPIADYSSFDSFLKGDANVTLEIEWNADHDSFAHEFVFYIALADRYAYILDPFIKEKWNDALPSQ